MESVKEIDVNDSNIENSNIETEEQTTNLETIKTIITFNKPLALYAIILFILCFVPVVWFSSVTLINFNSSVTLISFNFPEFRGKSEKCLHNYINTSLGSFLLFFI